jgi:aminoglycoside 2''-phosphotransferase
LKLNKGTLPSLKTDNKFKEMYPICKIRNAILTALPDFHIEAIECIGEGTRNSAYRINNEFIFRFPKDEQAEAELISEVYLLRKLEAEVHFSLSIPHFEFFGGAALEPRKPSKSLWQKSMKRVQNLTRRISPHSQGPQPKTFVGYREIRGSFLTPKLLAHFSEESQQKLAQDLAQFLFDLHSFPLHNAEASGFTIADHKRRHEGSYKMAKQSVFPKLSTSEQKSLSEFFQDFMKEQKSYDYEPKLIHGDLAPEHILVEEERDQLSGIIDFGGALIGDPDYDFTYLWIEYGRDFLEALLKNCPVKNFSLLLRKMKMAYVCHCIYCIGTSSKAGDQEGLAAGWSALRAFLPELKNA